ncbi:MAG: T9SS type A sorting domain-containing protein [Flavobacterium sp.]|nr:T9SS type A sorting domain-containing protein [Flavobacterium sp.]
MMKKTTSTLKKIMLLFFLSYSLIGYGQHFIVTLDNFMSTSNTFEVDVILIIDSPAEGVRLCGFNTGINFNPAILDGGTPCTTPNCGSWSMIDGSTAPEITANGGLNPWNMTTRNTYDQLRIVQAPKVYSLVDLVAGSYRIGRFRFTNTVPWAVDSDPELWLQPTNTNPTGSTNTIVWSAPFGTLSPVIAATTTTVLSSVTLGYTQGSPLPMLRLLNSSLATESVQASEQIATAFPNPFSSTFKLNLTTVSNELVQVSVYDMLGKLIEDFKVESNGVNSFTFGEKYAAGFYNVKVSQGDRTQVLRMIKQ